MKDTYILKDKLKAPPIIRGLFWPAVSIWGIAGLAWIAFSLQEIFTDMLGFRYGRVLAGMLPLLIGLLVFRQFLIALMLYTRVCIADEKGFTIVSCRWFKKEYAWSDVSSIVLCDANYYSSRRGDMYGFMIRIAVGNEQYGPLSGKSAYPVFALTSAEGWRTLSYSRRHFSKVFLFDFTPERYDALCKLCGAQIPVCISKAAREKFSKAYDFSI